MPSAGRKTCQHKNNYCPDKEEKLRKTKNRSWAPFTFPLRVVIQLLTPVLHMGVGRCWDGGSGKVRKVKRAARNMKPKPGLLFNVL